MKIQTVKKLIRMKKVNFLLVLLILVLGFIIWSQTFEYKNLNHNNNVLRDRNDVLEKENKLLLDSVKLFIAKNDSIASYQTTLDKENSKLRKRKKKLELELISINGRYKNISNDSLLISLKKAYEMDSISNTTY